jgi:hypothetical protein
MSAGCSLKSTLRQLEPSALGSAQASSVIPLDKRNEAESATVTRLELPLNESAAPYLPPLTQLVFASVPVFPLPELSATLAPAPSLNEYAATNPPGGGGAATTALA